MLWGLSWGLVWGPMYEFLVGDRTLRFKIATFLTPQQTHALENALAKHGKYNIILSVVKIIRIKV